MAVIWWSFCRNIRPKRIYCEMTFTGLPSISFKRNLWIYIKIGIHRARVDLSVVEEPRSIVVRFTRVEEAPGDNSMCVFKSLEDYTGFQQTSHCSYLLAAWPILLPSWFAPWVNLVPPVFLPALSPSLGNFFDDGQEDVVQRWGPSCAGFHEKVRSPQSTRSPRRTPLSYCCQISLVSRQSNHEYSDSPVSAAPWPSSWPARRCPRWWCRTPQWRPELRGSTWAVSGTSTWPAVSYFKFITGCRLSKLFVKKGGSNRRLLKLEIDP